MNTRHIAALAAAFSALAFAPVASAQDYYYDADAAGTGFGGSGVWVNSGGHTTRNWTTNTNTSGTTTNGQGVNLFAWVGGANAFFAGTPGTVTVNQLVTAGTVTFNVDGYSLARSTTNTLTANSYNVVDAAHNANVGAGVIAGSLVKNGAGTLTLTGSQSYTGTTTISGGTLRISAPASLPTGGAVSISGGSTLALASSGSYTLGSLTLGTDSNTIDFGNFAGTVSFSGFSTSVLGGQTVGSINYVHSGSSTLRFTSGFTAGLTNLFKINNEAAGFLANGDLVLASAIPEPSSFALLGAFAALGFAATRRRRAVAA